MTRTKTTAKTKKKAAPRAAKKVAVKKATPKKVAAKKPAAPAKKAKGAAARPAAKKPRPAVAKPPLKKYEKQPIKLVAVKPPVKEPKKDLSPRGKRLQGIRAILLKQRELLFKEAESALNELPGQTIFPDLGDQASAEIDRNFMLRLRGREQRLLKKIDEAIERIDTGTFGICDDCGNEIDIKRLEARPVTTMCIECKTLQEEEEKLREP